MTTPCTPLAPTRDPACADAWVDAAPFRSHLRHLCATTGLPWQVVALYAGLSVRHADALLHGRRGRTLRRIPRPTAVRLWEVSPDALAGLRRVACPAEPTARRLAAALLDGARPALVAGALRWSPERLGAVLDGRVAGVTAVEALLARALAEAVDRTRVPHETRAA